MKNPFGKFVGFLLEQGIPTPFKAQIVAGIIVVVLAVVIVGGIVFGISGAINSHRRQKAAEADAENKIAIIKDQGKIELIEEKEKGANQNAKLANENSHKSEADYNAVIRRDSSVYNSNFSAAKRDFCRQFPTDAKCAR